MSLMRDARAIVRLYKAHSAHLDAVDVRSAIGIAEDIHEARRRFEMAYGKQALYRLMSIVARNQKPFQGHPGIIVVLSPGNVLFAERVANAAKVALEASFAEPYFNGITSSVTIDHDLPDSVVLVRDLDEDRNARLSRVAMELTAWALARAVEYVETEG